jgi:hypothetical protein
MTIPVEVRRELIRLAWLASMALAGPAVAFAALAQWTGHQLRWSTFLLLAIPVVSGLAASSCRRLRSLRGPSTPRGQFGLAQLMLFTSIAALWLTVARWDLAAMQTPQGAKAVIEERIRQIVGDGRVHLSQSLFVHVQRKSFDDNDLRRLVDQLPALRSMNARFFYLDLSNTQITDRGMALLADCHSLEFLTLDNTRVSPQGLKVIAQMPLLQALSLRNTRVPAEELAKVRSQRPKVLVSPEEAQPLPLSANPR